YGRGHGVQADPARAGQLSAKALALYQKDCGGGDGRACTMVGVSASEGKGSVRDEKRAVEFFQRGCDLRDGLGCKYLAEAYEQGSGLSRDRQQAAVVWTRACALGFTPACARAKAAPTRMR